MREQQRAANGKTMEQNGTKLMIGAIEIAYFGFFCFEPKIWPDKAPVATCDMPFTEITAVYTMMILCVMVPLRVWLQSRKD